MITQQVSFQEPQPVPGDVDHSDYYEAAIAGTFGDIKEAEPQPGYYRAKLGGKFVPVTFFLNEGELACSTVENGEASSVDDPSRVSDLWLWSAKNPVKKDHWFTALDTGVWPDEPTDPKEEAVRANLPEDPGEAVMALAASKIEAAEEWLDAHPTITNETDAAYAKSLENQLLALVKEADPIFEAEKKPYWDKCKAIDVKFSFRKTLGSVAGRVKTAWQDFAREQDRKKIAAARAEAAAEAERQRVAAAALAAQKAEEAKAAGVVDPVFVPAPPPPPPPAPVFQKTAIKGAIGRGGSVPRTYRAEVADVGAALLFFQNDARIRDALDKCMTAHMKAQKEHSLIDGVRVWNDLGELVSDGTKTEASSPAVAA